MSEFDEQQYERNLEKFLVEQLLINNPIFNSIVLNLNKLNQELYFHATSDRYIPEIIKKGLHPQTEWHKRNWALTVEDSYDCDKWEARCSPKQIKAINKARKKGVYFHQTLDAGIEQSLATVTKQEEGNPVVLATKVPYLNLLVDPEYEYDDNNDNYIDYTAEYSDLDEPVPLVSFKPVPPEDIACICTPVKRKMLNKMTPVDIGSLLRRLNYECERGLEKGYGRFDKSKISDVCTFRDNITFEGYGEEHTLSDPNLWRCSCRDDELLKKKKIIF